MANKEVKYIDANELIYIETDGTAYAEEWNADYEKGFADCLNKVMALPTIEASPCDFCQYDGSGNPCIACPATAKEDKDNGR